jgi:5'-deoxynucleotidase YfbR-like HD superfamily hydrolase
MENIQKLAAFLFEISTLRKIDRGHKQTLLTSDSSDNIGSHSHLVSTIGIFLAEREGADVGKVCTMCVSHDWPETRSNDHNWVHKKYVHINLAAIIADQANLHQSPYMQAIIAEYEERKTLESIIAKDSDTIGQIVLMKEYEWQGNREAIIWLEGKSQKRPYAWTDRLKLDSAKELGRALYDINPSDWWKDSYTTINLPFEQK